MKRSLPITLLALGAGAAVALPATAAPTKATGTKLSAQLNGANERPNPGDPDGTGRASIRLNQGAGRVCYSLSWQNITEPPIAAHIHRGTANEAGPVVVLLFEGTADRSDCVRASKRLIQAIRRHPARYYVNVHTDDFKDGAIRGQLEK